MTDSKKSIIKCVVVLMAITIICCVLLAVLNDLLYVSDSERTMRAIKKVYGKEMTYTVETIDESKVNENYGSISELYLLEDGNRLFKSTGINGYGNGTISLWVVVKYEGETASKIDKVVLADYKKQTIMSNITSIYDEYVKADPSDYTNGKIFTVDKNDTNNINNLITGATKSSNAVNNAINVIIDYVWGGK